MSMHVLRGLIFGENVFLAKGVRDVLEQEFGDYNCKFTYEKTLIARYSCNLIVYIFNSYSEMNNVINRLNQSILSKTIFISCNRETATNDILSKFEGITLCNGEVCDLIIKSKFVIQNHKPFKYSALFTQKELVTLLLLAKGFNSKQVADILSVHIKTVSTHKRNCMDKLKIYNNTDLNLWLLNEM